jgi:hypothetical protein
MKHLSFLTMASMLFALPFCFFACKKNDCQKAYTYTYYEPVYKSKDEVRANIKSNAPRPIEKPGKIYILGNTIFLNETDKGIHVIDNKNPSNPRNIAFIDIPGNIDIAVKGSILYADMYTDLVALDITDPSRIIVKKFVDSLFPYRYYGSGFVAESMTSRNTVIAEWVRRDTTVMISCDDPGWTFDFLSGRPQFFSATTANSSASASPVGVGGSMARFTIMNDRLYTVSTSDLSIYNISNAADPTYSNRIRLGWNIETIYPFKDKLFIGSQSGMFIYNVVNADAPAAAGQFSHTRSCDPVIADDNYAYITLRSGSMCQGFTNELDIVKLNNITDMALLKVYPLKNPHGLSKDGDLLFICDGEAGLKLYDASNQMDLKHVKTIPNLDAYDVIAQNKIALVVAKDGLYQYNYANNSNIRLLSKMTIQKF